MAVVPYMPSCSAPNLSALHQFDHLVKLLVGDGGGHLAEEQQELLHAIEQQERAVVHKRPETSSLQGSVEALQALGQLMYKKHTSL